MACSETGGSIGSVATVVSLLLMARAAALSFTAKHDHLELFSAPFRLATRLVLFVYLVHVMANLYTLFMLRGAGDATGGRMGCDTVRYCTDNASQTLDLQNYGAAQCNGPTCQGGVFPPAHNNVCHQQRDAMYELVHSMRRIAAPMPVRQLK
eukprot:SAG22_NODE_56_length_23716_cov_11.146759_20_plen_152_part_00